MRIRHLVFLGALLPWAADLQAQSAPDAARIEAARLFVEQNWDRLGLPGVAVAIATGDSVLLSTGFGGATEATPFPIGSVTKTLTAAAIVQSSREGFLELDDPIERWLPDFHLRSPHRPGSITVGHLLEHRSGLRQWSGHDIRAQTEGRVDHLAPRGPPGERAEYSSLNFILLGRILEEARGQAYGAALDEILLAPLEMRSAWVDGWSERPATMAPGHQSWFGVQRRTEEPLPPRYLVPAGFAGASAHDLARYGGMMVGGGSFAGTQVLDPDAVRAIMGPMDEVARALGWGRSRIGGQLVLSHAGNARTGSARMRLIPEDELAIVVLSSTNSGPLFSATADLMDGVHAILRGEPEPRVWPRERIFKAALLLATLASVARATREARSWAGAGYPVGVEPSAGAVGRLAFDVGLGGLVLIGVPRFVGVPLSTMIEYFPDVGIALTASVGAGVIGGVLRSFTRSAAAGQGAIP
jgi:CubicO group peptidase (beta-lactamase class C family)